MEESSGKSASVAVDQLLLAARAGDKKAYGRLVEIHQSSLRSFLRTLSYSNRDLADDLAQDTFLVAYRRLDTFRGEGTFLSWLIGIGYRQFLQHTRKKKRHRDLMESLEHFNDKTSDFDKTTVIDLDKAMQTLSFPEKTAITLNSREGFSHEEISNILNLPLGTVKSHISRGRDKLKKLLADNRSNHD